MAPTPNHPDVIPGTERTRIAVYAAERPLQVLSAHDVASAVGVDVATAWWHLRALEGEGLVTVVSWLDATVQSTVVARGVAA